MFSVFLFSTYWWWLNATHLCWSPQKSWYSCSSNFLALLYCHIFTQLLKPASCVVSTFNWKVLRLMQLYKQNRNKKIKSFVIFLSKVFNGSYLILWGAEIRLRSAVIILRRGIIVTMLMMLVVVVLWGWVIVVMVMMVTLDVSLGKQEWGRGRRRLLGGAHPRC